jgi:hypothetical protein
MLAIFGVFNEIVEPWKEYLNEKSIYKVLNNLFVVYFYCRRLLDAPSEDKNFNFCFRELNDQ